MARQKLKSDEREKTFQRFYRALYNEETLKNITSNKVRVKKPNLKLEDELLEILRQRKTQRDIVLYFIIILVSLVALAFFGLIFWNASVSKDTKGLVSIIDAQTLQVIAVSFFVQLIMVVRSITRSLWDDKNYLTSPLIERMYSKKMKNKNLSGERDY